MLDCLTSRPHGVRIGIEPSLDLLDHMLVLPARDPALLGRRTLALDGAALACRRRPVTAQRHSMLDVGEVIGQQLTGWAAVDILTRQVSEVLFAEPALRLGVRGHRLGQGDCNASLFAGQYLLSVEVATIGDRIELVHFEHFFGLLRHPSKLSPVVAYVYDLVRNNQMVFSVHRDLDIVADDTRSASAGGHRTGIWIGERYLLIWRVAHLCIKHFQPAHLLFQPSDLFLDPGRLDIDRFRWLLPIGAIELTQISTNTLLDLRHPPRHLGMRKVAVAVVHRLELAAVDGDAWGLQQAHLPA